MSLGVIIVNATHFGFLHVAKPLSRNQGQVTWASWYLDRERLRNDVIDRSP